jgi:hypothetical protein
MAWEQIAFWGLKLIAPAINAYRRWQRKPVFVERSGSGWGTGEDGNRRILHFRGQLTLTNQSRKDGLLVVRIQVGCGHWGRLEDCYFCDVGEERVGPGSPGVLIPPHTSVLMQIPHPFIVNSLPRPRSKMLSFRRCNRPIR